MKRIFVLVLFIGLLFVPQILLAQHHAEKIILKGKVLQFEEVEMKHWFPHRLIKATFLRNDSLNSFYLITASDGNSFFQVGHQFSCLCKDKLYTISLSQLNTLASLSSEKKNALNFVSSFVDFHEDGTVAFKERPEAKPSWMNLSERYSIILNNRVYFIEDISPKAGYSRRLEINYHLRCPCYYP